MLLGSGGAVLGADENCLEGVEGAKRGCSPSLLLVELVAHAFGQLLEVALGFGVVAVDHEVLEVPQPPAQVLESLALLQEAGDLGANLRKIFEG